MSKVVLITAQPRTVSTGVATTLRLAGGGHAKPYYYGSNHYRAGIAALSRFSASIGFDENGWTGGVVPTHGTIVWAPSSKADLASVAAYFWPGAALTLEEGEEDVGTFTARLSGKVADAQVQDHSLVITLADLSVGLDRPVVTARFAGTGGVEGGSDVTNRIKRRSWGRCFNVEGRVLDKANNVYEFGDLNFQWQQFDALKDIGRTADPAPAVVTWQGTVASTLTALAASVPVQGSGVVAPSIACAKWWTQPVGPLTADIRGEIGTGYVETCPEIAARILTALSGPTVTNTAAMAALRTGAAGIHIDEGENINSALNRLLLGVSVFWKLNADLGTITLYEFTFASPVASLVSDNAERVRTMPPVKTRRLGYQRSYRLHSDGEIASILLALDPAAGAKLDGIAEGATTNIRLYPINVPTAATITGNGITDAAGDYSSGVRGDPLFGPSYAEMDIAASALSVVALDDDSTTYDYTTQSASGFYNSSTGGCTLYLGAAQQWSVTIATGLVGQMTLACDGEQVRLRVAGVERGSAVAAPAALTGTAAIYPKFYAYTAGVLYSGLFAGAYDDARWPQLMLPPDVEIQADSAGTTTTVLPMALRCRSVRGSVDNSPDTNFAIDPTTGISATVNNTASHADRGVISLTAATASGSITVTATPYRSAPIVRQITITRTQAAPSSSGGTGATQATTTNFNSFSTTTFVAVSDVIQVRSTAGGTVRYSGSYEHWGDNATEAKIQYGTANPPTTDIAAATAGYDIGTSGDPFGGNFQVWPGGCWIPEATKTGLTASTDYYFRMVARRTAGSGDVSLAGGTMQVRQ